MTNPARKDEESILERMPPMLAKAERLRSQGNLPEAGKIVFDYLNDNFDDFAGTFLMATIMVQSGKLGVAQALFRRAAQLEPNIASVWHNLGICYQEGADLAEAETHFFRAMKLEPNNAEVHLNLSQLYVNLAQPHLAIKHADKCIDINPALPEAYYNRALAQVSLGNHEEGWKDYDAVLGDARFRGERLYGTIPRWNGVEGKSLIAFGEQGIGDEISFASCIPDLVKNNRVILECNPRVNGLL